MEYTMPSERAKIQQEARARRLASRLALMGGVLCADPDVAAATPTSTGDRLTTSGAPPSASEPMSEVRETEETSGLPRALLACRTWQLE